MAFSFLIPLVVYPAYFFGLWYAIIWSCRHASRGFKTALAICALAGAGCFWGLKIYDERVDWTSRGINPDLTGFNPKVLVLAGTLDYRFRGVDTGALYAGTARFEIRMRGADFYYAERWTGNLMKYGSWDALTLSLPDFAWNMTRSYSGSGHHGRGGSFDGERRLLVGRRLWLGEHFIGARAADEYSLNESSERFSKLKQYGQFMIPEQIELNERDRSEVLHVRRVEFLNEPGTNWFHLIKQKYFDHGDGSQLLWKTNLNEAGWSADRKSMDTK
jgi:hypothetical protein